MISKLLLLEEGFSHVPDDRLTFIFRRHIIQYVYIPKSIPLEDVRPGVRVQSHWGRLNLEIILR